MRKIKANKTTKKDVEKKRKKLINMMNELFQVHNVQHDEAKTMELVKKMFDMQPDDPAPAEKVASIYVDYHKTEEADKAVKYLEDNFPPTAYRLFLRSRVCDLKRDYGGCIKYSEEGLLRDDADILTRLMIHNILGHAYRYVGDADNSLKHYELSCKTDPSLATNPDMRYYVERIKREDFSNYLFSLHNVNVTREKIFEEICAFNELYEKVEPFVHDPATHPRHDKIRIGYISPDIRRHVVAFFSYAFFKSYDKTRFEVYIYARNKEDNVTQEFKAGVDGFKNILFDEPKDAAQKIKDDEIDILVDLAGHTANNCMPTMFFKAAPIQISGIGWFNTTGLKIIDYFMVDKYTDPVGLNEKFFSEKLLRFQHSHFCYMWHDDPIVVNPAPCTKNGFITFVSFNNCTKVTDEMLRTWAKIINAVPNSRLYLKGKAFRDEYGTKYFLGRIEAAGIPLKQVDYEPDEQVYLAKYIKADIALDTFPYPGGGTTCDALYMGLPVITWVGDRHNSRFGYSLLVNCGLGDLCAFSEEEYVQKAVDLANDWDRVRDYHLTIRRMFEESPVMDDMIYMGEVEADYEKIYNAWINGQPLPEFPQDPEPLTRDEAEEKYNRALEYLKLEPNFKKGKVSNEVNIKRALYNLLLAAPILTEKDAEIYMMISACREVLHDNVGAYDAICKAGEFIDSVKENPERFTKKFLQEYRERRGRLSLINGDPVESANSYDQAAELAEDKKERLELCSNALMSLHYLDLSGEDLAASHFEYQPLLDDIKPFTEFHDRKPILRGEARIKIGYLSQNFKYHETFGAVFGMITCHNKEAFEVFCYTLSDVVDTYTNLFKSAVEHFVDVSQMNYEEIANKIHDDEIDILVDLSGHLPGNALPVFAYKPAPIQVSGFCYPSTTGIDAVDYFVTDEILDPPGEHDQFFKEKLLYMPCFTCYAMRSDVPVPQYAPCTKRDYFVFGTVCSYKNISDEMLEVWKSILERVPKSVLLMSAPEFSGNAIIDQAYNRMKNLGFNMDKVLLRPFTSNYMAEMTHLDVILDAYPFVSSNLTLDSVYMGVPVVTFYGEKRSTRMGLSLLENIGIGDLAANSVEDYIERAVALVSDVEALDVLHKNLRTMLQKVEALNPAHYTKLLEQKYENIIRGGDN